MKLLSRWMLWLVNVLGANAIAVSNLTVDLDYAVYQGTKVEGTGLNVWKGIQYAASPSGSLRWRAPRRPPNMRNATIAATNFGPICPQTLPAIPFPPFLSGDENCLFLNVYAPSETPPEGLPVLVWIHGGGYGMGDGRRDLSEIIKANGNAFIGVSIQYRLGAFGFLSSAEVRKEGVVNAGLLDIEFALDWIQTHASKFGGDPSQVTISGESAGGGAVLLFSIARDGELGNSLFKNGIAASPWLPAQYDYDHAAPTERYQKFAKRAGCENTTQVLDCLRTVDSRMLQQANHMITISGTYGTWAFLPVTEPDLVRVRPSVALRSNKINGESILVGNNANEGPLFVPPTIHTIDALQDWLHLDFPTLGDADIQKILDTYASSDLPFDPNQPKFETNGIDSSTAVNISQVATGQLQRAMNIHAEARLICPSYWLNSAYKNSYHYQYSVPFANHQDDIPAYFGPSAPNQPPSFTLAFRQIWGNFVTKSNPSIASESAASHWPRWTGGRSSKMLNLNTTGGVPYQALTQMGTYVTQFRDPGVENKFTVANAWDWEGGRGRRCELWKELADRIWI